MKNKKEFEIILKPFVLSKPEHQKRVDEISKILYELCYQYRLKESVQNNLNNNNFKKETPL